MTTCTLILIRLHKKVDLLQIKDNFTKDRDIARFVQIKLSFDLGKNTP